MEDGTALLHCFAAAALPCLINLIQQIASALYELHTSDEINVGIVCSPKLISASIVIESELQAVLAPDQLLFRAKPCGFSVRLQPRQFVLIFVQHTRILSLG